MLGCTLFNLCMWCTLLKTGHLCDTIKLESLNLIGDVLTADEKTVVNITFAMENRCNSPLNAKISVNRFRTDFQLYAPICNIFLENDQCVEPRIKNMFCSCSSAHGIFTFTKLLVRTDSTQWRWSISHPVNSAVTITFNVLYPAIVTHLIIDGIENPENHFVQQSHPVQVVCSWENGNPSTHARLLDKSGNQLQFSGKGGNFTYQFPESRCSDTGILCCEALGSEKNMSAMVLVKCPPEVSNMSSFQNITFSQTVHLPFRFRSYTANITRCQLSQYSETLNTSTTLGSAWNDTFSRGLIRPFECAIGHLEIGSTHHQDKECVCSVNGTPPALTLTVILQRVTTTYNGWWQLGLSNYMGDNYLDFFISLIKEPSRVTHLLVEGYGMSKTSLVQRNQSIQIVCGWENGKPPVSVQLFDRNGKLLMNSTVSGNVTYKLPSVSCNDAGRFVCAAEGSEKNMSFTLLVACPPELVNSSKEFTNISVSEVVDLHFPVRAHTSDIIRCQLFQVSELEQRTGPMASVDTLFPRLLGPLECVTSLTDESVPFLQVRKCRCYVNGTPPDMTLVVKLYNITNVYSGLWRAVVSNYNGHDHIDFHLEITENSGHDTSQNEKGDKSQITLIVLTLGIVIGAVIIIVIVGVFVNRKVKSDQRERCTITFTAQSHVISGRGSEANAQDFIPQGDRDQAPSYKTTVNTDSNVFVKDSRDETRHAQALEEPGLKFVCPQDVAKVVFYFKQPPSCECPETQTTTSTSNNELNIMPTEAYLSLGPQRKFQLQTDRQYTSLQSATSEKPATVETTKSASESDCYLTPCPTQDCSGTQHNPLIAVPKTFSVNTTTVQSMSVLQSVTGAIEVSKESEDENHYAIIE